MSKSIIQKMIDEGVLSQRDIADYYQQELKAIYEEPQFSKYGSTMIAGKTYVVLKKFDARDLTESGEPIIRKDTAIIGEDAFRGCKDIKRIVLHSGIKEIGENAFAGCSNLESVKLPAQLSSIRSGAFRWCEKLLDININDLKGYIDVGKQSLFDKRRRDVFYGTPIEDQCYEQIDNHRKSLNKSSGINEPINSWVVEGKLVEFDDRDLGEHGEYNVPYGVVIIGKEVFNDNRKLKTIKFSSSVKKIEKRAFALCRNLEKVEMLDSVECINDEAFFKCESLKEIILSNKISHLPYRVFAGCYELEKIKLPESIEGIGDRAFMSCFKIQKFNIPRDLRYVSDHAFVWAPSAAEKFMTALKEAIAQGVFGYYKIDQIVEGGCFFCDGEIIRGK